MAANSTWQLLPRPAHKVLKLLLVVAHAHKSAELSQAGTSSTFTSTKFHD